MSNYRNKEHGYDWNRRCVDFREIHGNEDDAFVSLVNGLKLREGMHVGDLMCGYGEVSRNVLEYCVHHSISIRLFLLDAFEQQIERTNSHLAPYGSRGFSIERVVADVRNLSLENIFDRAVIKMGLHEVPHSEQERVLKIVHRSLKDEGEIFVWESMGCTLDLTKVFREVVRKKDELAGYTSFVENRYFPNESELYAALHTSQFKNMETIYEGEFRYETKKISEADFRGDFHKLELWNSYLRNTIADHVKEAIQFNDSGESISMSFTKKIIKATK